MRPRLDILPPPQRALWDSHAASIPSGWVLYGGTAIALHLGHRQSVDFDFFSDKPLDEKALRASLPFLDAGQVLHRAPNTLTCSIPYPAGDVKVSFFGGIDFGRVERPEITDSGVEIAALLDLLATKLKVLLQRVEVKDYVDIAAILRTGISLTDGLAAASALFPRVINPLDAAKAVAWFKDGDLEKKLPEETRRFLTNASASVDPAAIRAMPRVSEHLSAQAGAP